MLFLAIMGFIIFLLALFSVISAHQSGGGWKFLATVTVLSALVTIYAVIKLPYWPYNQKKASSSATTSQQSVSSSKTTSSSAKIGSSQVIFNEDSQKRANATLKLKEKSILSQLQSNYEKIGEVSFDREAKTFTIKPTNKDYVKSLNIIKKYPDDNQKAIDTITNNFKQLSSSIKKNLAAGYTVQLQRPDQATLLLKVRDGQVLDNQLGK
ncbi:hypothetical protein [Lactiplantibacillus modestisalitolerans]|uniref:DUF308 domain-containing protein n=1 Tax=Lactiplantibacillus modestisalitolerans TaxID=1457219 RepID=A0ABV5WTI7_9LACO|nr:hypothetical protein [Lactiplantibacillus modestisalitolerans]